MAELNNRLAAPVGLSFFSPVVAVAIGDTEAAQKQTGHGLLEAEMLVEPEIEEVNEMLGEIEAEAVAVPMLVEADTDEAMEADAVVEALRLGLGVGLADAVAVHKGGKQRLAEGETEMDDVAEMLAVVEILAEMVAEQSHGGHTKTEGETETDTVYDGEYDEVDENDKNWQLGQPVSR
jgi:hypothetical protein